MNMIDVASAAAPAARPAHRCNHCGAHYSARRSTARYCSSNCRVAAHREAEPESPAAAPEEPPPVLQWLVASSYAGRVTHEAAIYGLTVPVSVAVAEWNDKFPAASLAESRLRAVVREAGWLDYGEVTPVAAAYRAKARR